MRADVGWNASQDFSGCLCRGYEQRGGDGALLDGDNCVGAAAAIARSAVWVKGDANAIAIRPWICGENFDILRCGNAGSVERLAQDCLLECELVGVVSVLIVSAAADAEVGTSGRGSLRG